LVWCTPSFAKVAITVNTKAGTEQSSLYRVEDLQPELASLGGHFGAAAFDPLA